MSQERINTLGAVVTVAMFIISIPDLVNKDGEWYQWLTWRGWAALLISLLVFGIAFLNNRFIREQRADADRVRKDHDTLLATTARIDSALKARNLEYNPATGSVTNIAGDDNRTYTGPVAVHIEGSYQPFVKDVTANQYNIELSEEGLSQFCSKLNEYVNKNKIVDKDVYVWSLRGTTGAQHFPEVSYALGKCGYQVIKEKKDAILPTNDIPEKVAFTTYENKAVIIIGKNLKL